MTTYRINLTGEYDGRILADCANVRLQLPDGGTVIVPVELATEVKPPLPPIPDAPAVLIGDRVFAADTIGGKPVFVCPGLDPLYWNELAAVAENSREAIIPLIPDPAADAPALPWTLDSCRRSASVGTPKHGTVVADVPGVDYTPGELEQIARALLGAARAAREVEPR